MALRSAVAAAALAAAGAAAAPAQPPHLVFILADDLGWSDVGYHNPELHTPAIDALAAGGVRLEHYYAEPVCTPSRAALLTARYPFRTGYQLGVVDMCSPFGMPEGQPLLPEALREQGGYATHMAGKWHVGHARWEFTPLQLGFDTFVGYYNGVETYTNHTCTGPMNASPAWTAYDFRRGEEVDWAAEGRYSTEVFAEEAVARIEAHDADEGPMFLYLALQAVHEPVEAPDYWIVPECEAIEDAGRRTFCGMAAAMDSAVANVTAALQAQGMWDNTVLVWASDNGALTTICGDNSPLKGNKGTLYEGGVRVPAFVHSPLLPEAAAGTELAGLAHVTDWGPTLLGLAGLGSAGLLESDGVDLWGALASGGAAASPRKDVPILWTVSTETPTAALIEGDWKLLVNGGDPVPTPPVSSLLGSGGGGDVSALQLFNLTADPYEETDVAELFPDVVADLLARVEELQASAVEPLNDGSTDWRCYPGGDGYWSPWIYC